MTKRKLTIATRESLLALRQTELIKAELLKHHPHLAVEFLGITTMADKNLDITLTNMGGKGMFVKELEEALYNGRADIAVHSMKDVTMDLPDGMTIPVICEREDARDAFVSNQYQSLLTLPAGASVGTASLRRKAQIAAIRADVALPTLRGNIHTRLKRLDDGEFDSIILASAGLLRMGLSSRIKSYLSAEESLPAAGQGALGIECKEDDETIINLIKPLNHEKTFICVTAERAMVRHLNGGCMAPIAAYAEMHHSDQLVLRGMIASLDGKRVLRTQLKGHAKEAESLGAQAAEILLNQGAKKILRELIE